ncbi:hypothetical protein ACH4CD_05305 [Streptomyces fungicidicus]|uniref:hypothetical protein n=1 Tax=Streptomyces fungicidicus TaxID=68203 RepID=UPI00379E3075
MITLCGHTKADHFLRAGMILLQKRHNTATCPCPTLRPHAGIGDWIQDTARAWSEVSWEDLDPDEDPRLLSGILVEDGEGGWAQHDMSFAEWLYRYLVGEDMADPNTSVFYPGPVRLRRLPMTADERPEPWSGPERGM